MIQNIARDMLKPFAERVVPIENGLAQFRRRLGHRDTGIGHDRLRIDAAIINGTTSITKRISET